MEEPSLALCSSTSTSVIAFRFFSTILYLYSSFCSVCKANDISFFINSPPLALAFSKHEEARVDVQVEADSHIFRDNIFFSSKELYQAAS